MTTETSGNAVQQRSVRCLVVDAIHCSLVRASFKNCCQQFLRLVPDVSPQCLVRCRRYILSPASHRKEAGVPGPSESTSDHLKTFEMTDPVEIREAGRRC